MFYFSVNVWNRGGVAHLNHKGLMTYDRKTKKDAFYFYKANWSSEPVLYIVERRNKQRTQANTQVKIYTNSNKPIVLFVNGKKVKQQKLTSDIHILLFEDIELVKGENIIRVESKDEKNVDEVVWVLN